VQFDEEVEVGKPLLYSTICVHPRLLCLIKQKAQELQERQHSKDIKVTFNPSRTNKLIGRNYLCPSDLTDSQSKPRKHSRTHRQ
ncbi:hypothetical protein, partial [Candidatus Methanoperedens sp. BLZ2]|uniref:hypothetical protein n=1 Tax=Candidatus Methanoperedens sp. BLZ2 TaxID=2035255 RepID=UPI001C3E9F2C